MNTYIHEDKDQIIRVIKLTNRNMAFLYEHLPGDNIVLGYHDRIDSSLIHCKKIPEFKKMWYTEIETIARGNGKTEVENVYVFREEDTLSKIRDQEFWEDFGTDKDDFPFIFVTFMRINTTLSSITTLRKQFEDKLYSLIHTEERGNKLFQKCKIITYSTTDISDIVLVTRSKSHKIGTALIEALSCANFRLCQDGYNKREIKDALVLCCTISAFSLTKQEGLIDEEILQDTLDLQIRVKASLAQLLLRKLTEWLNQNSTNRVNEEFAGKIICQSLLGKEDFVITISSLTWQDMRYIYQGKITPSANSSAQELQHSLLQEIINQYKDEETSPMSYVSSYVLYSGQTSTAEMNNDPYRVLVTWIISQFSEGILCCSCSLTDKDSFPSLGQIQITDKDTEIIKETWQGIRSQLQSRIRALNKSKLEYDVEHGYSMVAYKSVLQTLNYIEKYGSADLPQYGYMIILDAFLGIVDNMLNYDNVSDKNRAYTNETRLLNLLININSILQNSIRAERHYFASPEMNWAIADMPPKLISMHASFLQKLQTLLKNIGRKIHDLDKTDSSRRDYSVLYYPGVTSPESEEITYGNKNNKMHRLNIVRTNAQFAMDIKNLWLISSHEMAHTCGRQLKNRQLRHDCVISLCLHAFFDCEIRLITERFNSSVSSQLDISPSGHNKMVSESAKYYIEKIKGNFHKIHQLSATKKNNNSYKNIAKDDIYARLDEILFPITPVANGFDWLYNLLCEHENSIRPADITTKDFKIKLAAAIRAEEKAYEMRLFKIQLHNVYEDKVKTYHDRDHVTLPNLVHQSFNLIDEVYADVIEILVTEASPRRYFDSLVTQYAAMGNYRYDEDKKSYGLLGVNLDQLRVLCTVGAIIASEDKIKKDYGVNIFSKSWKIKFNNMRKITSSDSTSVINAFPGMSFPDTRNLKHDLCYVFIDIQWEKYFNPSEPINLPNYGEYIFQSPFIVDIVVHFIYNVILHFSQKTCLELFDKILCDNENKKGKIQISDEVKKTEREKVEENEKLLYSIRQIYLTCSNMESLDDFTDYMYRLNYDLYQNNIKIICDFYNRLSM